MTKECHDSSLLKTLHVDLKWDFCSEYLVRRDLGRMENVVEEVEDQGENEGSPANSQRYEDMGGCEVQCSSLSVKHVDLPSLSHRVQHHQDSRHCQTD